MNSIEISGECVHLSTLRCDSRNTKKVINYQIFITADGANVPGKRNKGNVNGTGLP